MTDSCAYSPRSISISISLATCLSFLVLGAQPSFAADPFAGGVPPKPPGAKAPVASPAKAKEAPAKADDGKGLLRPTSHAMLATFALGPQIKLKNMPSQFAMELAFGYHFSGEPTGPMVGAVLTPAFGNGVVTFGLLARFAWGFRPFSNLSFIVAPFVEAGWQHSALDVCDFNGNCRSEGDGAFDLGFGVDARVTIAGRWVAFVRPVSFGIYFGSRTASRYGLLFGGGASF